MIKEKELHAMVALLDDPDKEVSSHVMEKIIAEGPAIIPSLEKVWEDILEPNIQESIESLIHKIYFEVLLHDFAKWAETEPEDLLKGVLLLCKYQYPELDSAEIGNAIDVIKQDIWLEIGHQFTPLEQVNIFNNVFYKVHKLSGDIKNITDPQHFFINKLLETKKGNPLSLGILYLLIAQLLKLPIYGVNLPNHFILCFSYEPVEDFNDKETNKEQVAFYINTYSNGIVFSNNEIQEFIKKLGIEESIDFFVPCTNSQVMKLLLQGLRSAYDITKQPENVEEIEQLIELM